MAFAYTLPLRIVQAVFAVIVLGLMSYAADAWSYWWSPDSVNFLVFASVWTLLALIYLVVSPTHFPHAAHKYGILFAEAVTMIFWFAGFVALAVMLNNVNCGHSAWSVCQASIAGDVFAALLWLLFAATTMMAALHVSRTRGDRSGHHDPAMEVAA
ncbi:hypothetical protein DSL72_001148 [Monilinia vaccinii-corymbosi]|uniref:MARVEL domain-containing protein n=1 Tax=Monilinia vaccinii-corymbosi TaxID=61207 RepID=A0A8A3P7D2_9HELO|nr:hypothetical protein DSL72_001148 [Monilinia vaccinii-corymbosi]